MAIKKHPGPFVGDYVRPTTRFNALSLVLTSRLGENRHVIGKSDFLRIPFGPAPLCKHEDG